MPHRSGLELKMAMLALADDDEPHIQYEIIRLAPINGPSFKNYMPQLLERGLMKQIGNRYIITDKGKKTLSKFNEVIEAVE